MSKTIFSRLKEYYIDVAKSLKNGAGAASIFPNKPDIGSSREQIYAEFLRGHIPSKCNVFLGGFVFDENGNESKQLDIIVATDTTPSFNFFNKDDSGKSFSPVEGTLGVLSIKSKLTKESLCEALENIASIPQMQPLNNRVVKSVKIDAYDNWPLKVIYASDGLEATTITKHLDQFYEQHPEITLNRRPDIIQVAEKYVIFRGRDGMISYDEKSKSAQSLLNGDFYVYQENSDIQAMLFILNELQKMATASSYILFNYDYINQKIDI